MRLGFGKTMILGNKKPRKKETEKDAIKHFHVNFTYKLFKKTIADFIEKKINYLKYTNE